MNPIERRAAERTQVELPATIERSGERPALAAVVRDISESGARLEGKDLDSAPETFDLTITHASGVTEIRHAHLVWQSEGVVGVEFGDYVGA